MFQVLFYLRDSRDGRKFPVISSILVKEVRENSHSAVFWLRCPSDPGRLLIFFSSYCTHRWVTADLCRRGQLQVCWLSHFLARCNPRYVAEKSLTDTIRFDLPWASDEYAIAVSRNPRAAVLQTVAMLVITRSLFLITWISGAWNRKPFNNWTNENWSVGHRSLESLAKFFMFVSAVFVPHVLVVSYYRHQCDTNSNVKFLPCRV